MGSLLILNFSGGEFREKHFKGAVQNGRLVKV